MRGPISHFACQYPRHVSQFVLAGASALAIWWWAAARFWSNRFSSSLAHVPLAAAAAASLPLSAHRGFPSVASSSVSASGVGSAGAVGQSPPSRLAARSRSSAAAAAASSLLLGGGGGGGSGQHSRSASSSSVAHPMSHSLGSSGGAGSGGFSEYDSGFGSASSVSRLSSGGFASGVSLPSATGVESPPDRSPRRHHHRHQPSHSHHQQRRGSSSSSRNSPRPSITRAHAHAHAPAPLNILGDPAFDDGTDPLSAWTTAVVALVHAVLTRALQVRVWREHAEDESSTSVGDLCGYMWQNVMKTIKTSLGVGRAEHAGFPEIFLCRFFHPDFFHSGLISSVSLFSLFRCIHPPPS